MKQMNRKVASQASWRAKRVRKKLRGTAEKPRMCAVKSNKHLYVQLIDDVHGVTLASASTGRKGSADSKSKEAAEKIGLEIAEKATKLGISAVVFDRGPFAYHGVLAALADAARKKGLQF
jgi:large subunit ribosomal protein L18